MTKFWLILISIYTLRDLMFQAIWLVHYLWLINNYYSRPIELIIHSNKKKNRMAGLSFIATVFLNQKSYEYKKKL